jgi:hypothetical protein
LLLFDNTDYDDGDAKIESYGIDFGAANGTTMPVHLSTASIPSTSTSMQRIELQEPDRGKHNCDTSMIT